MAQETHSDAQTGAEDSSIPPTVPLGPRRVDDASASVMRVRWNDDGTVHSENFPPKAIFSRELLKTLSKDVSVLVVRRGFLDLKFSNGRTIYELGPHDPVDDTYEAYLVYSESYDP